MPALAALCENRINLARNSVRKLKKEPRLKIGVVVFAGIFFLVGGYFLFWDGFAYVKNIPTLGVFLVDRLLGLFFMALFCMLIFSNLIVAFATFYRQKELDFLIASPLSFTHIFSSKFVETLFYSSWPFLLLSLPFIAGYATVMGHGWQFYLFTFILFPPFLIIPSAIGCLLTLLLARLFPIRRSMIFGIAVLAIFVPACVFFIKFMSMGRIGKEPDLFMLTNRILVSLRFTNFPFLPNHWVMQGIQSVAKGDFNSAGFYLLLLWSNALMAVWVLLSFASRAYYTGWASFKDSASRTRTAPRFNWVNRLEFIISRFTGRITASLLIKDILVFLRDPSQWLQFTIFFGLLAIYISNLRNLSYDLLVETGKNLISFLNLISTCFVLSSLTTRFVFPLFSLEGRRFWVVGLAPLKMSRIIFEKYWFSVFSSLIITESLMIFSNIMLRITGPMFFLSCGTVLLMSFTLPAIAVGLGTVYPDFKEENPARIVSGLGGTICIVASLGYVGVVITIEALPVYLSATQNLSENAVMGMLAVSGILVVFTSFIFAFLPMYSAIRSLKNMEF
ncbi:MAG: hypothetical protein HY350_03465 [Candidatus Omnitrophica bacterium]|nr:hypothetical protein [Candidatus Omnitrophota bacterium]